MHQPRKYYIGAFVALVALALLFSVIRYGSETVEGLKIIEQKPWGGYSQWPHYPAATTYAPNTTETVAPRATELIESPPPFIESSTVGPEERPQSYTTGDDSAAWHCLAIHESGNGSASSNIYGIISPRVRGMSAQDQLAWARRIRDEYGTYRVGWPQTAVECGLP